MPSLYPPQTGFANHASGFISTLNRLDLGHPGAQAVWARFNTSAFHPELFNATGLHCPEQISRAVKKRQAEFLAGRIIAGTALSRLGARSTHVAIADDRAPVWPDGMVGSISHTGEYCAAVAMAAPSHLIGLDIEAPATGSALASILSVTMNARERTLIETQRVMAPNWLATLAFSAKETLYKSLYPVVRRFFGFDCAELLGPPIRDQVVLRLTSQLHPSLPQGRRFAIRYQIRPDHILTWLILPAPADRERDASSVSSART